VRGFGQSDKPAGPYTPHLFAHDLAGLICALGISKAHVAGISMGGVIAQRFTLDYPELVSSLTLISTSSEVSEAAQKAWEKTASIIEQRGFSSNLEAAQRVFAPSFAKNSPHAVQVMAERTATNDPRAYAAPLDHITGPENWDVFRCQR
jgi:3-oxoadipate enol-lactonase